MALLVGVVVVSGGDIQILAQSADPFVGTWDLDVKASRFKPTAYTRSVIKIEAIKEQRKTTVDSELDGTVCRAHSRAQQRRFASAAWLCQPAVGY